MNRPPPLPMVPPDRTIRVASIVLLVAGIVLAAISVGSLIYTLTLGSIDWSFFVIVMAVQTLPPAVTAIGLFAVRAWLLKLPSHESQLR